MTPIAWWHFSRAPSAEPRVNGGGSLSAATTHPSYILTELPCPSGCRTNRSTKQPFRSQSDRSTTGRQRRRPPMHLRHGVMSSSCCGATFKVASCPMLEASPPTTSTTTTRASSLHLPGGDGPSFEPLQAFVHCRLTPRIWTPPYCQRRCERAVVGNGWDCNRIYGL
jgi:hypothetical protein